MGFFGGGGGRFPIISPWWATKRANPVRRKILFFSTKVRLHLDR